MQTIAVGRMQTDRPHHLRSKVGPSHVRSALLIVMALAGCQSEKVVSGTQGEKKRVDFSYQRSCFFGCPLEQPLLVGAHERIALSDPGDADGMQVSTSDADIAEFALERGCFCEREGTSSHLEIADDATCEQPWRKHCDNTVLVHGLAVGQSTLELRSAEDRVLDRVEVTVHDAASARFEATPMGAIAATEGTSFALTAGESLDLAVELFDEGGLKLLAPDGVRWRVDDDEIATLSAWLLGSGKQLDAGLAIRVDARAAGETGVVMEVPGLQADVDIQVHGP